MWQIYDKGNAKELYYIDLNKIKPIGTIVKGLPGLTHKYDLSSKDV